MEGDIVRVLRVVLHEGLRKDVEWNITQSNQISTMKEKSE